MEIAVSEFAARREKLKKFITPHSFMILFSGEPIPEWNEINYPFEVDRNFFYLTGIDEPNCVLIIGDMWGRVAEQLYVPRCGAYDEVFYGKTKNLDYYRKLSGIHAVSYMEDFEPAVQRFFQLFDAEVLYTGSGNRAISPYSAENLFIEKIRRAFPYCRMEPLAQKIFDMRVQKSEAEVDLVRRAIEITGRGIDRIMRTFCPGMNECQAQACLDYEVAAGGGRRSAAISVIAGGKNNNVLHYFDNNSTVNDGELLLMDICVDYGHYNSDITRTIPANGVFTPEQKHWYNVVLKAQEMIISRMGPGIARTGINDEAVAYVSEQLLSAGLIKSADCYDDLVHESNGASVNAVDHCIGLLAHDVNSFTEVMQPGMIFTVEPGVYLKDLGFGIRIEDDILITETGIEVLSRHIPKSADDIERIMAEGRINRRFE